MNSEKSNPDDELEDDDEAVDRDALRAEELPDEDDLGGDEDDEDDGDESDAESEADGGVLNYAEPPAHVDLITIATFHTALEAHIAATRLHSEGIGAVVVDEMMSQSMGWGVFTGGVKLQVARAEAKHASELIESVRKSAAQTANDPICPECRSRRVFRPPTTTVDVILTVLLLGLPLLLRHIDRTLICADCGREFQLGDPPDEAEETSGVTPKAPDS